MNKHTPGPWHAALRRGHWRIESIDAEKFVWDIAAVNSDRAHIDSWTQGANARLIAAAPDLLAALERITHPAADASDIENALAVIRQARGEA